MPVILETISWILKNVNVGVDGLIVGYGVRFVYSALELFHCLPLWTTVRLHGKKATKCNKYNDLPRVY